MHVTTKEVDQSGSHILTSTVEGDGPNPICSENATLSASVISVRRTDSGGVQVQTALTITEPAVVAASPTDPNADAIAYLVGKGFSEAEARADIEKFGADRVRAAKAKDDAELHAKLDAELAEKLASAGKSAAPPAPPKDPGATVQ